MKSIVAQVHRFDLGLGAILLLGLALRLWGINFGLPYLYHPDESVPVTIALRMLQTGDFNPQFFNWPSLLFYLNALVYFGYFILGRLTGGFASPADLAFPDVETLAVGKAALPAEFLLSRGLTAVFGALSIVLVYLICLEFYSNKAAGWLGALLLAVESVDVMHSHFIRPDTFAVFFALVALFFALQVFDDPQPRNYVLAGIGAGLATSSKYNVALIFIPIVVAHLIRFKLRGFLRREIFAAALVSMAVFFLTTPFALLDVARFMQIGPFEDTAHYTTGHPGAEGNTFEFYVSFLWATQGWILIAALCEMIFIILRREEKGMVLLSFPLVYFIFINFYTVHFDTTILPMIPFLIILAALFVMRLYDYGLRQWSVVGARGGVVMMGAAVFLALPLLGATAANNARILQPDGREQSRKWIDANLPPGSRIALESYAPYIDRKKFIVNGFYGLQDHGPDWYISNGFEYLIFSQGAFGRYFIDPTRYAVEVGRYNAFFSRFHLVARFDDNGYEIRIYKTAVTLPVHRVAARFGDYGDLVELIGYDDIRWVQGEPLPVRLFWRTLRDTPEPLALELRLLEPADQQIAVVRNDLFQGKGWPQGMFATELMMSVPDGVAPGVYRLDVGVIQTRYAYRVPLMNWAEEKLERLWLSPVKMTASPPSASELQSAQPANVRWADNISLIGYTAGNGSLRAGSVLPLTLYWKSLANPARDYTVFIHLLDAKGKLRAQIDTQPQNSAYSTSLWSTDEIIRDDYLLYLPADLDPGAYRLEIGLYQWPSLERLDVIDSKGQSLGDHWSPSILISVFR